MKLPRKPRNTKQGPPGAPGGPPDATYILYIENPLKSNHFSINPLFLLAGSEIHRIPPVHTKENQQNTKYKENTVNRQTLCFPMIFLLIDMFLFVGTQKS